jgi:DNA-binding NarL/FixJ family response regulator
MVGAYLPTEAPVRARVLEQFAQVSPPAPESPPLAPSVGPESFEVLIPRELEVLSLIARGLRNREIAGRLVISEKTVGNHVSNIFTKLQVHDRSQGNSRYRTS